MTAVDGLRFVESDAGPRVEVTRPELQPLADLLMTEQSLGGRRMAGNPVRSFNPDGSLRLTVGVDWVERGSVPDFSKPQEFATVWSNASGRLRLPTQELLDIESAWAKLQHEYRLKTGIEEVAAELHGIRIVVAHDGKAPRAEAVDKRRAFIVDFLHSGDASILNEESRAQLERGITGNMYWIHLEGDVVTIACVALGDDEGDEVPFGELAKLVDSWESLSGRA